MNLSDYLEAALLDHTFRGVPYTAPATVYLALSTADPTDTGAGIAEPAGGAYARAAIANDGSEWVRSVDTVSNINQIAFAEATGAWGTLTHWALFDAAAAGNMLVHGALQNAKAPVATDTLVVDPGELTATMAYSAYLNAVLLDHAFGLGAFVAPGTLYAALSTTAPGADGATATEPAGGYARQAVAATTAGFSRAGNLVSNAAVVAFPKATASWGTISHFMVFDAAAAGNMLLGGPVQNPRGIGVNDTAKFAAGALQTTLD